MTDVRPVKQKRSRSIRLAIVFIVVITLLVAAAYVLKPSKASAPVAGVDTSVRAIDTTAIITDQAWFDRAYDEGFRLYVLHSTAWDTCDEWYRTVPQLQMAIDAGLKIAAYTRDPRCWKQGILATQPYVDQLQFFALDIEKKPGIPVTREMVDGVKSLGVRPVIYTGAGMWDSVQANLDKNFSDVPLWDTNVGDFDYKTWTADYLQPAPVAYGGWNTPVNMRIGVQQQFEYKLNGVNVDLNSFRSSFLK